MGPTCGEIVEEELIGGQAFPLLDSGTLLSHEEEMVCSNWGFSHYETFDNKSFYFPGTCTYNLAFECSGIFHVQVGGYVPGYVVNCSSSPPGYYVFTP